MSFPHPRQTIKVDQPSINDTLSARLASEITKCMSGSGEHLKDEGSKTQVVIAGATAVRFVIAPLDVVKIRLQLQTHSLSDPLSQLDLRGSPIYKGTLPTIKHILREEGLTGLWKGNIPAELMYVAYGAIQFTAYRTITLALQSGFGEHRLPTSAESFIAGAGAGAIATTATYPLDVLRTRFAAQGTDKVYSSLFQSIRDIARQEGPRGFFQGVRAGIGQIIPYMGIFFATYEALRLPLGTLDLPLGSGDATAGVIASVISKTGVFPLDLIKKRLQIQGPTRSKYVHKNIPVYQGVFKTFRHIIKSEGPRGLYRGLTVSLIKAAPASAVTMWTYERVLNILLEMENTAVGAGEF
ncbi:Mitochondrial thiamine pyrophosphate carrier 1 [Venustampulla echinocandica]|uniref:Mitochondrial thiamine pyrophosphate carrier 1 n=1 Tax=Venustampulla echinocandica TaxID=2656787 RepID=A0A370TS25_9HELO|nr:Mitochondrial thiamine pyrophosphate carrier 1 [Venustampulla echinocandica]RDL38336.1 Mitochondrial thiamine pyrophosphate carrier 1 [Venustampulla echinocandica]